MNEADLNEMAYEHGEQVTGFEYWYEIVDEDKK